MQNKLLSSNAISLRERVWQAARQVESDIIIEALEQNRWNRRRAAEALKISYRSLMYKMKNCGIPRRVSGIARWTTVSGAPYDDPHL